MSNNDKSNNMICFKCLGELGSPEMVEAGLRSGLLAPGALAGQARHATGCDYEDNTREGQRSARATARVHNQAILAAGGYLLKNAAWKVATKATGWLVPADADADADADTPDAPTETASQRPSGVAPEVWSTLDPETRGRIAKAAADKAKAEAKAKADKAAEVKAAEVKAQAAARAPLDAPVIVIPLAHLRILSGASGAARVEIDGTVYRVRA